MKKIIVAFLLATLCFSSCSEDDISGTIKMCSEINGHLSDYKKKSIDLTGITAGGGSVSGYFKGKHLVMATVSTFAEYNRNVTEYYFDDDKLACVLKQDYTYNQPTYYTDEMAREDGDTAAHGGYDDTKTKLKVTRYYFYDGRMVKWFDDNNKLISDNDRHYEFQTAMLLSDAEKLQKMLKMD